MDSRWNSHTVTANGIRIHLVEAGDGPLVLLCHGFPESWYSWRRQLGALADAGYRAVAMDMRGYGRSSKPRDVEAYVITELVADCVGVVEALGESQAVIVGHDWGAAVAWTAAWTRPDVFRAVAALSVPFGDRGLVALPNDPLGARRPSEVERELAGVDLVFYQEQFASFDALTEIEPDIGSWVAGALYAFSASVPLPPELAGMDFTAFPHEALPGFCQQAMCMPPGGQLRDLMPPLPDPLPSWLSAADLAHYRDEFERTGLFGGLAYYACLDRDWELLEPMAGKAVTVPSLFIGGDRDIVTIWGKRAIELFAQTQVDFRGSVIVNNCGHWIQQEQPAATNDALVGFLKGL
ncbi:MAG: alpha/beta fold hydrolase [Sporichthyaceae bacterium]